MSLIHLILSCLAVVRTIQASLHDDSNEIEDGDLVNWIILCRLHLENFDILHPLDNKPPPPPPAGCQRRVCYFTNWSQHGAGVGFPPNDFDTSLCTHVIIWHARFVEEDLYGYRKVFFLKPDQGVKQQILALKKTNRNLKVLVSVRVSDASSRMMKHLTASKEHGAFGYLSVSHLIVNGFDGLDWYYPAGSKTPHQDKINISLLIKSMRRYIKKRAKKCEKQREPPLLMTATLPADKATIHAGFDIPSLDGELDFVNLMTHDSPEDSDVKWRHISPLFGEAENTREHNVDFYAKDWIEKGFPKDKIVIGIPAFGSSFSMKNIAHNYVTYNEVCEIINDGAWLQRLPKEQVPYLIQPFKLVSFDDPQSVTSKVKYSKAEGYGGVMVRSLNDFNNTACKTGKYPLLSAIKQECS